MDLVLTIGPWQSIVASAALRQADISSDRVIALDLCNPGEETLVDACRRIHLSQGHRFLGGVNAASCAGRLFRKEQRDLCRTLQKVERIWTFALGGRGAGLIDHLPQVPIRLYEDGLLSGSAEFIYGLRWKGVRASGLSFLKTYIMKGIQYRRPWFRLPGFSRIEAKYHFLEELYEGQEPFEGPQVRIDPKIFCKVLNGDWLPSIEINPSIAPRALVLGSNFVNAGRMLPSLEYGVIEKTIERLAGEYEVWWKPHPRADPIFTRYLRLKYPFLQVIDKALHWVPVECLVQPLDFRLLISPMSSSLFYSKLLHGIEVRISPGFREILFAQDAKHFQDVYLILEKHVPLLE